MDQLYTIAFGFIKTRIFFKQAVLLLSLFLAAATCQAQIAQSRQQPLINNARPEANQLLKEKLTYKIIEAPNKTFGYDIDADARRMIHQPSIPGLPGNEGFQTRTAAAKVAQFAVNKISNGEALPTITFEELRKLKVLQ